MAVLTTDAMKSHCEISKKKPQFAIFNMLLYSLLKT